MISPVKLWRNQKQLAQSIGKTGRVVTFTVIRVPTGGFSTQAPYAVGVVEFADGKRRVCQIVDCAISDVVIGMTVISVIRRIADSDPDSVIPYGIKVRPL